MAIGPGCDPGSGGLAGLAHDIGHPPYGHNGERRLTRSQTVTAVSRATRRTSDPDPAGTESLDAEGRSDGLNLTRAALDAVTKHPWGGSACSGPRKFGFYDDDAPAADGARAPVGVVVPGGPGHGLGRRRRLPVHDVEDGVISGRIDLRVLADADAGRTPWHPGRPSHDGDFDDMPGCRRRLSELPVVAAVGKYDGVWSRRRRRSSGSPASWSAGSPTPPSRDASGRRAGTMRRFTADLAVPPWSAPRWRCSEDAGSAAFIMSGPTHLRIQADQRTMHPRGRRGDAGWCALATLDPRSSPRSSPPAADDGARLRVVVDQIASFTETRLERVHAAL